MQARFLNLWYTIRASYWIIPSIMAIGAVFFSFIMIGVDNFVGDDLLQQIPLLYVSDVDGERAVLSTIAGSMMTITSIVYSLTMVALTLASQQFGPRLLGNFMRDRSNQVVLGTFISTFIYSLLVLRSVSDREDNSFVPQISVLTAVLLALLSLFILIYFINHIAESIRVSNVITSTADELQRAIERLFPEKIGASPQDVDRQTVPEDELKTTEFAINATGSNYLQAIDDEDLIEMATEHDLQIHLSVKPGDFVIADTALMQVNRVLNNEDDLIDELRELYVFGKQRTVTQDVTFLFDQLLEIALRALSPGINDPNTAIACLHRITAALCDIAQRKIPSPYRYDEAGALRVVAQEQIDLPFLVTHIGTSIRAYAGSDVTVLIAFLELLAHVAIFTDNPQAIQALQQQIQSVIDMIQVTIPDNYDRNRLKTHIRQIQADLRVQ
ncbi:MAG: DUF2254 domain-containing protein [Aggregatilineales bacterium]